MNPLPLEQIFQTVFAASNDLHWVVMLKVKRTQPRLRLIRSKSAKLKTRVVGGPVFPQDSLLLCSCMERFIQEN